MSSTYSEETFEKIRDRMLNNISNPVDKREGSIVYDTVAPTAAEVAQLYIEDDYILTETYADTASRAGLIKRCKERGITPYPATYAVHLGIFTPSELTIPLNSRFTADDLTYYVSEKITDGQYKLICETAGTVGNNYRGNIIPLDYIQGLETARIEEIIIPARDIEETEALRKRYYASFNNKAFGGNIADYKAKCGEIGITGGVKIIPCWNGGGTVKLICVNTEFTSPSAGLLTELKEIIDPVEFEGQGYGVAPIGHIVTVVGAESIPITITAEIEYIQDITFADLYSSFKSAIQDYLYTLRYSWADSSSIVIRLAQIETLLYSITGVNDISNITINGESENLTLSSNQIPIYGGINGETS